MLQSGGPTSVLNASLVGIIQEARNRFGRVLGSRSGFTGLVEDDLIDVTNLEDGFLSRLARTPSAALGTSRLRPNEHQLQQIMHVLDELNATAIVGIGGNDTADSLLRLEQHALAAGRKLHTVGIPKTIDNDLAVTDHSLGYPSAARVIAAYTRDAIVDTYATSDLYPVKLIEVMGRNAGWLAASGALWAPAELAQPRIALPERPFDSPEHFLAALEGGVRDDGYAVLVAPETMRWADGTHVAGATPEWVDAFGHPYHQSAGQALLKLIGSELGLRGKLDRPGSITRSSADYLAQVDVDEAEAAGRMVVAAAADGASGQCVVIKRIASRPYSATLELTPLANIANVEATIPDTFINEDRTLNGRFFDYARPLVGEPSGEYAFLPRSER